MSVPTAPTTSEPDRPDHREVNQAAKRGVSLMMLRQIGVQALTFAGGIVLARVLDPAEFGLFAIAMFLVYAFGMLGDFGLAAALIQRRDDITDRELQVGFTVQQVVIGALVGVVWFTAPTLAAAYPQAPPETVWLIRTLSVVLLMDSWQTMSKLKLERALRYDAIAWVEVVMTLGFQGTAVLFAVWGHGVWALIYAALLKGILGTALMYAVAPWPIRFAWDTHAAWALIRFGIPFQAQQLVNALSGWVTPLAVGVFIGPTAVGYLTWASSNGRKPLVLAENVRRVAFPHLSRLQQDPAELARVTARYLGVLLSGAGLWVALLLAVAGPVVAWVYTDKWLPAVPALVIFGLALALDMACIVAGTALNATGRVGLATRIVAWRTAVNLVLAVGLIAALEAWRPGQGFLGVALAYVASTGLMAVWSLTALGRGLGRPAASGLGWLIAPLAGAVFAGMAVRLALPHDAPVWTKALIPATATTAAYAAVWLRVAPASWRERVLQPLRRAWPGFKRRVTPAEGLS